MTALRLLHDSFEPGRRAPALMALLPGAMQRPEDLLAHGLADALRRRGLPFDIVLADPGLAHIGAATDSSGVDALDAELLRPASRQYREVWVAGISLGGFLALAHAARHPGIVHGLCLLAPYPGTRLVSGAIARAGGLTQWAASGQAPPGYGGEDDDECRVWRWLAGQGLGEQPEIHLGYGDTDRFAGGQRLMASALPAERVCTVEGGHDWPTWGSLWEEFLDRRFGAWRGEASATPRSP
jgi:pimeloyl-ACP methyl ester carboxylesterase